ncbi:MAG TPA: hypothetical protein VGD77_09030 [Gemmatimonadaceae bacterium]
MDFQLPLALAVLERTPATFRALLGGLPEAWTTPNEGPDTFSAFDAVMAKQNREAVGPRRAYLPVLDR